MKRVTALFLALLMLGLTACGAPEAPAPVESLAPVPTAAPVESRVFALGYDPTASLHPITGESQVNLDLTGLVYQSLYQLNNNFEVEPVLAESASVDESGLLWWITVKPGVVFSDGTPLTVDHVAASLSTARKSALYGARLANLTAVRVEGEAVAISLAAPNGELLALLDIPVVLEQEEGPPLGSGGYRFVSTEEGMALSVNGNYPGRQSLPYETIPLREVSTADRRIAAFDSGEVSAVTTDFSSPYALGYSGSYELFDYPTTNLIYIGFQTTKGACAETAVRRACALAFDRVSVAQSLLGGHGDPASLPIHPNHRDYDTAAAALLDYDIQRAQELLTEAGYALKEEDGLLYKKREPLTLTLVVNRDSLVKQKIANYLADSLRGIGITVTVNTLGWTEYQKALETGEFDLYLGEIRLTGTFDCTQLLTGSLNYGGFVNEELPLLLEVWNAAGGETRTSVGAHLWQLLAEEVPIAPLCFKEHSLLVRWGMVSNLSPTRGDPFSGMEQWIVINQ